MKYLGCLLLVLFALMGCRDRSAKNRSNNPMDEPHQILIVINDRLWYGSVGDSIREHLAVPIEGITPPESTFSLEQISPNLFSSRTKNRRNIIVFSDNYSNNSFLFEKDKYTAGQMYFTVSGDSRKGLISEFKKNSDSIVSSILRSEFDVVAKRILEGKIVDIDYFQDKFQVSLNLPTTYKLVGSNYHFVWFKKNIASGNSNILIYDVPMDRIENRDDTILNNLLAVKDSVNGKYIHSIEDNSYLRLNEGFIPNNKEFVRQGRKVYEFTGNWDMHNSFMSGPYMSYVFRDESASRYLFIEGLVYNPAMGKRGILMEVESIVNSLKFNESETN
ncbi:DUF4837 family protein [Myroides odoratimimus]|uniref:DUF4837 family protein n=1 Tax=Myroides odoratimimus TaxID=76832 RepID=UPI001E458BC0|nr:DUF4837 family protein [Myroides odoratimimus]